MRAHLNKFYEQQAQIKYLFYDLPPIPISEAPRLALVLEREQKKKEQQSINHKINEPDSNTTEKNELDSEATEKDDNTIKFQDQRINSFEDIYGSKKPIELSKLFEKQDNEDTASTRVFVRGQAGIGKTTLLQYIANECSQGRLWKDRFDRVFWIPLRNLTKKYYTSGKEITLAEVIYQECFQTSPTVTLEDVERLLASNPKILWLLDGYDEIAVLDQEDSSIGRLLKKLLLSEHVILTSRPYAIPNNLQGYKQLENIGFLNEDIEDYVKKFFTAIGHPEHIAPFLAFLKQNPLLWGSAHIPIILELMCSVWNERKNQGKALNTGLSMTELYKELVLKLCIHYLKKRSYQPIKQHELDRMTDSEVLEKCQTMLGFLSELAFEASHQHNASVLINNILIQNLRDKYKKQGLGGLTLFDDILESHFLKNTGDQTRIANQDFYFVHLTFQSYFTAYHIVRKLKQKDSSIIQFIKDYKYAPAFETTWWFVAGLLKDDSQTLEMFFDVLEEEPKDLIGLYHQLLLMRCMDECYLQVSNSKKKLFFTKTVKWLHIIYTSETFNKYLFPSQILFNSRGFITQLIQNNCWDILLNQSEKVTLSKDTLTQFIPFLEEGDDDVINIFKAQKQLPTEIIIQLANLLSENEPGYLLEILSTQTRPLPTETFTQLIKLFDKAAEDVADILKNQPQLPNNILRQLMSKLCKKEYESHVITILLNQVQLSKEILEYFLSYLALVEFMRPLNEKEYESQVAIILNDNSLSPNQIFTQLMHLLNKEKTQPDVKIRLKQLPIEILEYYIPYLVSNCNPLLVKITKILSNQSQLPIEIVKQLINLLYASTKPIQFSAARILITQSMLSQEIVADLTKSLPDQDDDGMLLIIKILSNQSQLSIEIMRYLLSLLNNQNKNIRDKMTRLVEPSKDKIRRSVEPSRDIIMGSRNSSLIESTSYSAKSSADESPDEYDFDIVYTVHYYSNYTPMIMMIFNDNDHLPIEIIANLFNLIEDSNKNIRSAVLKILMNQTELPSKIAAYCKDIEMQRISAHKLTMLVKSEDEFASRRPKPVLVDNLESVINILDKFPTLTTENIGSLIDLLHDSNKAIRDYAENFLNKHLPLPKEILISLSIRADRGPGNYRYCIRKILSKHILPEEAFKIIAKLFLDRDLRIRIEALQLLGDQISLPNDILSSIIKLLQPDTRRGVNECIAVIVQAQITLIKHPPLPEEALKQLISLLQDECKFTKEQTQHILISHSHSPLPQEVLKQLVSLLQQDEYEFTQEWIFELIIKQPLSHISRLINNTNKNNINYLLKILIMKALSEGVPLYIKDCAIIVGINERKIEFDNTISLKKFVSDLNKIFFDITKTNITEPQSISTISSSSAAVSSTEAISPTDDENGDDPNNSWNYSLR